MVPSSRFQGASSCRVASSDRRSTTYLGGRAALCTGEQVLDLRADSRETRVGALPDNRNPIRDTIYDRGELTCKGESLHS